MGDIFLWQGRTSDALEHFRDGLKITSSLAEADPSDVDLQRSLSVSFEKHGDVYLKLNQNENAINQFQIALKIRRTLAAADPEDAEKEQSQLALLDRLGDANLAIRRTDEALKQFEELSTISRKLADGDPSDVNKQRDLSVSFLKRGEVFLELERGKEALVQFESAFKIGETLAKTYPNDPAKQRDLMIGYFKFGEANILLGEYDAAIEQFDNGTLVVDRMIAQGHFVKRSQQEKAILERKRQFCRRAKIATGDWNMLLESEMRELPALLIVRANEMLKRGEFALAVQAADRLRASEQKDGAVLYNLACIDAKCAAAISKNKPTLTDAEQAERQKFVSLAIESLKRVISAGWNEFNQLRNDADLSSLRGLPEFESLLPKK